LKVASILIDGTWRTPEVSDCFVVRSPADREPLGAVARCGAAELDAAVAAARAAFAPWKALGKQRRAGLLAQCAEDLRQRSGALARIAAQESGEPYRECLDAMSAVVQRFSNAQEVQVAPGVHGVNIGGRYSLLALAASVAPLLAAGSTLVCLVPAAMPLATLAAAQSLSTLPRGVFNILPADADLEGALFAHAGIDAALCAAPCGARLASERGEPATADFILIARDADLELAVGGAASLRLFDSGQRPGQSARIHVEQPLLSAFAERLHQFIAFLECGDPARPITDLGPLGTDRGLREVQTRVGEALRRGVLLKLGGRPYQPWGLTGYFFQPTLMIEAREHQRAPFEEVAGPVLVLAPAADLGRSLQQCRCTAMPTPACVWLFAADLPRALDGLAASGFTARLQSAPEGPLARLLEKPRAPAPGELIVRHVDRSLPTGFPYAVRSGRL